MKYAKTFLAAISLAVSSVSVSIPAAAAEFTAGPIKIVNPRSAPTVPGLKVGVDGKLGRIDHLANVVECDVQAERVGPIGKSMDERQRRRRGGQGRETQRCQQASRAPIPRVGNDETALV